MRGPRTFLYLTTVKQRLSNPGSISQLLSSSNTQIIFVKIPLNSIFTGHVGYIEHPAELPESAHVPSDTPCIPCTWHAVPHGAGGLGTRELGL